MSKLDDLKAEMGFTKSAPMCGNCKHFTTEKETTEDWAGRPYTIDKMLRCSLGGFKVGKSNWCERYERKE